MVFIELALQLHAVSGEVAGLEPAVATGYVEGVASQELVVLGRDVAKAGHDCAAADAFAAHEGCRGFAIAGFRHGARYAGAIDLVHEVAADKSTGVGKPGVEQQPCAFERSGGEHNHARFDMHLAA